MSTIPTSLSFTPLLHELRRIFATVPDPRVGANKVIPLVDALLSGFAMFSLKDPSLLAFDHRRKSVDHRHNLKAVFAIERLPCDTQMRTLLDSVQPQDLRPAFTSLFAKLQRSQHLKDYQFLEGGYLLSLDGTGYFSSTAVHCPSCMTRHHKGGTVSYCHHFLVGCLVHPDRKEVFPLAPEPIQKQDGQNKNDCERNAAKRFIEKFRKDHPFLPVIVIEDALSANAPHIQELQKHHCHFILGVKSGDHTHLFATIDTAAATGKTKEIGWQDEKGETHRFRWVNQVALNESHPDVQIHVLEYWNETKDQSHYFSWVTDFPLSEDNVWQVMRGGRSRWKIENETFNTLKNQGYHFEHNFGHGKQNLSVVLALLMLLAFLVDQIQQKVNLLFKTAWKCCGSKRKLWETIRGKFESIAFSSMEAIYEVIINPQKIFYLSRSEFNSS